MITDQNMQELLHYQPEQPVLSVYLNTDPVMGNADFHRLQLRSMLKDISLEEDAKAVLQFIEHEHDWSGKSVAIFSCVKDNYFRAFSLAMPLRSRVRISDRPHVKPLANLLDSYGGYGVVLVDKQGSRFYYFHLGELQEEVGVKGEMVRHTKRGGGSQSAGRRGGIAGQAANVDEVTERNMRESVEAAYRFFSENNIRRIVIGGTDDNVAMFRNLLPKAWQSLVVGSFAISMQAGDNEVLEKAMEIGEEAEHQREMKLVKTVVTNAAKGRGGVTGLQATLDAIREGRVQNLVIIDGFRKPGWRCTICGHLSTELFEKCPFCGGVMVEIPDAVELAVRQVMSTGGDVDVLHGDPGLDGFEEIGALLRY
jgi:peptide chain release factor subunit 1